MANPDVTRGLIPVRTILGAPYTGQAQTFLATGATGAIGIGSPVTHGGTSGVFRGQRYTTVAGGFATSNAVVGVCVGIEPVTRESTVHRATSTDRLIHVCTDPMMLFAVQDNEDTDAAAVLSTEMGMVADLSSDSVSTVTGRSLIELDGSTATATYTPGTTDADVEIVEVIREVNNVLGAHAKYLVRLLNHHWGPTYNRFSGV